MAEHKDLGAILILDHARRRWRFIALVLAVVLIVWAWATNSAKGVVSGPHVAQIEISGLIMDNAHQQQQIEQLGVRDDVKAVIAYVDSPGGTMVGALMLHDALERVAKKKPVVVVMGTVAASAGYLVSLAGEHVLANEATLTGSVGVYMPLVDATGLADKIGIKDAGVVSGSLKDVTSPLNTRNEREDAYLVNMVERLEDIFIRYVTGRFDLSDDVIKTISDGRAVIGVEAYEMGMVDGLGGIYQAREWLNTTHSIPKDMPMRYVEIEEEGSWFGQMAQKAGLDLPVRLGLGTNGGAVALYNY